MNSSESVVIPETVLILNDRLKHGANVVKILENQIDTAQQNIVLLQGQVRLASETITNLKKHFQETENLLNKLFEPESRGYDSDSRKDGAGKASSNSFDEQTSPLPPHSSSESNKSFDGKNENTQSPYAQQLRQVLDVLQDKEPRKSCAAPASLDCNHPDCLSSTAKLGECNSSCCNENQHKHEDSCKTIKREVNGHERSQEALKSPQPSSIHTSYSSSHCSGPCCASVPEKGHTHYVTAHSPTHATEKNNDRHHSGQCGEKCQCHGYVNYVPYGYHMMDSSPGIPESIQPLSPSQRPYMKERKRSYISHSIPKETQQSKYTTVKRIERSKLTAQKMLQDFARRQFFSYNPRYDLDLLIVSPPIPAYDLVKEDSALVKETTEDLSNVRGPIQGHDVLNEVELANEYPTNCNTNNKLDDDDDDDDDTLVLDANKDMNGDYDEVDSSSNRYIHPSFKSRSNAKLLGNVKEENMDRLTPNTLMATIKSEQSPPSITKTAALQ